MFMSRLDATKCKAKCRQCIQRLKLQRNKKTVAVGLLIKDVAVTANVDPDMAMLRVETVLRSEGVLRTLDIMELFLELVSQRSEFLSKTKELPEDCRSSICSLIYAAGRLSELPELMELKSMFSSKYGKKLVQDASNDALAETSFGVHAEIVKGLKISPPDDLSKYERFHKICADAGVILDENFKSNLNLQAPSPEQLSRANTSNQPTSHAADYVDSIMAPGFSYAGQSQEQPSQPPVDGSMPQPPLPPVQSTSSQSNTSSSHYPQQHQGPPSAWATPPASSNASNPNLYMAATTEAMRKHASGEEAPAGPYLDTSNPGRESYPPTNHGGNSADPSHKSELPPDVMSPPPSSILYGGKTLEQIQAEYDAAPGPPSKQDWVDVNTLSSGSGKPSAPPTRSEPSYGGSVWGVPEMHSTGNMSLPDAPTEEILPSASNVRHSGVDFRHDSPRHSAANVDDELASRLARLRSSRP